MPAFYALIFALSIPLTTPLGAAEKGIVGHDDRVKIDSRVAPWTAIGRVNIISGAHCTGTLISPTRVLTAAHCLWNVKSKKWIPPHWLHFMAGYYRGNAVSSFKIASYFKAPGYPATGGATAQHINNDWAILTLSRKAEKSLGTIAVSNYTEPPTSAFSESPKTILQAGYSKDMAQRLSLNQRCRIVGMKVSGGLLAHDCDAVEGDSGSPILQMKDNHMSIIGVHVGSAAMQLLKDQPKQRYGIAVPANEFIDFIK